MSVAVTPRVLSVGAYERDNFGDLLFLLVTERYLEGSEVVASAPFAADMTALLDRKVGAVGDALSESRFDAIWTVGGQVGGTSLDGAFKLSKSAEEYAAYLAASPSQRRELARAAVHGAPLVSPYIPTPGAFELNAGAVTVLNSVGIAGIADVRGRRPHVGEELVETLRTTDAVSVRDRESSSFLDGLGIPHTLAPDVVHAISLLEPFEPDPASDVVVFQAATALLERIGHRPVARALATSSHLRGLRIQLLMAGAATGHDSVADLERVADHIREVDPGREVEVLTGRRPLDIVHQIRQARIVIGTSLHVRIVAAAYSLPRVTLRRVKPARYAAHWDDLMPFNVRLHRLDDALGAALAAGERPEVRAEARELSRLADDNVRAIADRVRVLVARGHDAERQQLVERRQRRYREIAARRATCDAATDRVRDELDETRRELESARAEVDRLEAEMARRTLFRRRAFRDAG